MSFLRAATPSCRATRGLHTSTRRSAVTPFKMPAMSPTMTEGGIASWKLKEGEKFSTGDILLEIETDKATMDVEAQDDGIMGKIVMPDGSKAVPVGKVIALLAEEGDDISNLEVPAESSESASASTSAESKPAPKAEESNPAPKAEEPKTSSPSPSHTFHPKSSHPIFPSVLRLLQENNLSSDVDKIGIKGTGIRGMLTKGDVLAYLGKASSPSGTYKEPAKPEATPLAAKPEAPKPLTGDEMRRLIIAGMERRVMPMKEISVAPTFDSILDEYLPSKRARGAPAPPKRILTPEYLDGLFNQKP